MIRKGNTAVLFILFAFITISANSNVFESIDFYSPDEKIHFSIQNHIYSIKYNGKDVLMPSKLGIGLNHNSGWSENAKIIEHELSNSDSYWEPIYGERNKIRDHYNQLTVTYGSEKNIEFQLIIRAYNSGIAFKYYFPENPRGGRNLRITSESTEFVLPDSTYAWFTERAQSPYKLLPLNHWPGESERPLTLELKNGLFASLHEAQMVNYSRTKFKLSAKKQNAIICSMYGEVDEISPFSTPWRVVMIAENPSELLQNNDLILNLNPPCHIENTSWIAPGKVMREITLSTSGARDLVDFAVKHNLQYIHFDAGWYGYEYITASDPTTITVDPRRNPKKDLDLHKAISYAKSKGIGVIVYVNQRHLANHLDEILPLYKSWGIDGIKFGFVQVGSHRWTNWLHEAVKKCAKYELMVDIHDEYRPTGFSRTYPNLLTQEGIRGNEEMPDATHNTILPFTRFLAGPADYTICYYYRKEFGHPKRHILTTPAHQISLAVVYYSPLQYMYWYDKPEDIQNEPELEFFDNVPVVWDASNVIHGEIGQFVSVARKKGEEWFIGSITNNEGRELEISLDFLDNQKKYTARIYSDGGESIKTRTKVKIEDKIVDSTSTLKITLKPSGGQAVHLTPL